MGNQPALDGIRAVSVALVVAYHAGLAAAHGGFLGVEVFFVVSGYLITTLLLDERQREGRIDLRAFWMRRARRLLPALYVMVIAVTVWAVSLGREHVDQLRRDLLPALFYVGNWGQVFGDVAYFAPGDPLLRHVWSLAVEEQWYLLWPIAFVVLVRVTRARWSVVAAVLAGVAVAVMATSALLAHGTGPISVLGHQVDRFNLLYLGTFSRSSGLLLGAALGFVWRPWEAVTEGDRSRGATRVLDAAGLAAIGGIVTIALTRSAGVLTDAALYRRWLPAVTVLSAVAIASVVAPWSRVARAVWGCAPLAAIGRRSYGIYLWHWPVFVLSEARTHHDRLPVALLVTAVVSELCYRFVETPVRRGALGRWWAGRAEGGGRAAVIAAALAAVIGLAIPVVVFRATDPAVDTADAEVVFDPVAAAMTTPPASSAPVTPAVADTQAVPGTPVDADADPEPATGATPRPAESTTSAPTTTLPPTTVTLPTLPRSVTIVGDSQAHSLAVNLPSGIDETFRISDGSVSGCGVWSTGSVITARPGFHRSFGDCSGWEARWGRAVERNGSELALVVIGAWDLFDLRVGDLEVAFGSPDGDALFLANLQRGIDAVHDAGAHVALLEVACMRPQDVDGAGVPALPERADDGRVAHLNDLLRSAAAADPAAVTFVEGPDAWCVDPAISTDLSYRWDGVHVYRLGAKLILETIAAGLLAIPL